MTQLDCTLFDRPGAQNTQAVADRVSARLRDGGIRHVVVASNTGASARQVAETAGPTARVVCVTHQVGFAAPGVDEMPAEARAALTDDGIQVLTATHLMAGIDRACRFKAQGLYPAEIVAHTLRILGHGLKVAVEVATMALDAGLVPHGEEVIAVGGTGRGADTACVILPAHGHDLFASQVREVLCMPRGRRD